MTARRPTDRCPSQEGAYANRAQRQMMTRTKNRTALLLAGVACTASLLAPAAAFAQTQGPAAPTGQTQARPAPSAAPQVVIQSIRVEGTQRIEPDTVRNYLNIRLGEPVTADVVDKSLKTLFATGLFADVSVGIDRGDILVVRVVENPIVNRIAFEGLDKLEEKDLLAEMQLRPRVVYTRSKLQADVQRLLDVYRRNSRFAASIEPKIIQLDQNRVDVVFEVKEGDPTTVSKITFVGNKQYSDSTLRSELMSSEYRWYRFWASDDSYDPDRVAFDREKLRRFYLKNGYADFRIQSAVAELAPDRKSFYLTFTVEEGQRYKFGKINISSQLKNLDPSKLGEGITTVSGEWYNNEQIEATIEKLTQRVGDLGYAFVDVQPVTNRDPQGKVIDVSFEVREGPKAYVERIDISGNVRTQDRVLRREFRLVEGDAFNASRLRRSEQRIKDLGFFKSVEVTREQGSQPDQIVLKAKVEEQSTGDLTVGGGFSTSDGPLGEIGIRERNLLGRGQDLKVTTLLASKRSKVDISFVEPYFLDRQLALTVDAFHTTRDLQKYSSYDWRSTGGAVGFGWQLNEDWSESLKYTLRSDSISDIEDDASRYVKESAGTTLSSFITHTIAYDKRDSRRNPTDGYVISLENDIAGLGGDTRYLRTTLRGEYYYPVMPEVVASLRANIGNIVGFGEDVRINDRFYLGGEEFRGFRTGGVGTRDKGSGDALGAQNYYVLTQEVSFPLGLPKELGLTARLFHDIGSAWGADVSGSGVNDSTSIRASVGIGFTWVSPFGPIRVDFGIPYLKQKYDRTQNFTFGFATRY